MTTRRRVLAAVGASMLGLAGCSDDPPSPSTEDDDPGQAGGTPSPDRRTTGVDDGTGVPTETANGTRTDEPAATETTGTPGAATPRTELDLREANVVDVAFEESDGAYRFDVTLLHDVHESEALVSQPERSGSGDDDGEGGYADWWAVEAVDGTELARRELAHAHGTREFTRSARVRIPADTACVVVRGHDRTHGYGGSAVLANVETGETATVRQGSDPAPNAELAESCP